MAPEDQLPGGCHKWGPQRLGTRGALARFKLSPIFEPLLLPCLEQFLESLGAPADGWEEAQQGEAR